MVSKLRNQGHEIAVHSITHRTPGNLLFVDVLYNYSLYNYTLVLCEKGFHEFSALRSQYCWILEQ